MNNILDVSEKINKYIKKMTIEEKIGQVIMPAFRSFNHEESVEVFSKPMEEALKKYKVGGVILFKENIINPDQLKLLINNLKGNSHIPLWIGVDEEGGRVSRIASNSDMGYENIEKAYEIGQSGDEDRAFRLGQKIGKMLKELGFNMDFAPVADIWSNPDNQVIGKRSYGTEAKIVSRMATRVVDALEGEGILSVAKHFPGHGDTSEDSHIGRSFVDRSLEELREREFIPFQHLIEKGVPGIMVAHVELPQIDEGMPSSLSKVIISEILKKQMDYKGLIMTDALDMKAITDNFGYGETALLSFMAGTDLLLMPNLKEAHRELLEAYEKGTITDERLEHSLYKILSAKYRYGLIDEEFLDKTY